MASYYCEGTVTLVAGSKAVAGNGTAWQTALISGGNIIVEAAGNVLPIASVNADNLITAELAWSGASGTYSYAIQRDTAYLKTLDTNSQNLAYLLAELRRGTIFKYDVAGPLDGRSVYDGRQAGFAYLATDPGELSEEDSSKLYVKLSATAGDWAGPFTYGTGPQGAKGEPGPYTEIIAGNVQTLAAGQPASVTRRQIDADTVALDFAIPKGADATGDVTGPSGATAGRLAAFDGQTGKVLKDSGVDAAFVPQRVRLRVFTASATYVPDPKMSFAILECWGGGGGGGGAAQTASGTINGGGGGGSGGKSTRVVTRADIGASQPVIIGAAGSGGAAGANQGGAGGSTSVGSLCVANGGAGGLGAAAQGSGGGGAGGAGGTGDLIVPGCAGIIGNRFAATTAITYGRFGGDGLQGVGFGGALVAGNAGTAGSGYSAGGGGGSDYSGLGSKAGGNGAPGLVIITEYCGVSS